MGSSNYFYRKPEGKKYSLSVRDYNRNFAKRGRFLLTKIEVFTDEKQAVLMFRPSLLAKFIYLLTLPVLYPILSFIHGYREINSNYKDIFFDKSRGSYQEERFYRNDFERWAWLMKNIK